MSDDLINKNRFMFLGDSPVEIQSDEKHLEKRQAEITELSHELKSFSINLKEIANIDISIKERNLILNLAFIVASNENLLNEFLNTKRISLEKISSFTYEPILNIAPFKEYLKLYILLIYSEKYSSLVDYLNILEKDIPGKKINLKKDNKSYIVSKKSYSKEAESDFIKGKENYKSSRKDHEKDSEIESIDSNKDLSNKKPKQIKASSQKDLYSGIIISKKGRKRIVLTATGEIKWIKKEKNHSNNLGELITSKKVKSKRKIKITMGILVLVVLILFTANHLLENKVATTVLFKASGDIKITFNENNKLIHAYATNKNGNIILEDAEFQEKNMDYVLGEILEQAYIQKVIKEFDAVTIIVSGIPAKEEDIINGRFKDRLISYKVKCKINNDGTLIYLN